MRALVFDAIGKPLRETLLPDPRCGRDEVVLKICRCGICGSDLHMTEDATFGLRGGEVIGHEFSGEVIEVGADVTDLRPGDLVFFNTMRRNFSHVGIYVGDGKFIHSPRSGSEIRVEDMGLAYWSRRFNGARRVTSAEGAATSTAQAAQQQ